MNALRRPLLATFALALLVLPTATGAQQASVPARPAGGLGLNVAPGKIDLEMPLGARYNLPMTVKNEGTGSMHVVVSPSDFKLSSGGEYAFLKVGASPYSLLKFATVNPREFDLPAGTIQQVRVSFALPSTDLSGEYTGIVLFQTRPERRGGNTLSFSARIASKIYATIADTGKRGGEVAGVSVASTGANEKYRVNFKNTGNVHCYLGGFVEVRKNGEVVDKIKIPDGNLVERNMERSLEVTGKHLDPGTYDVVAAIDYGGQKMVGGAIKFTK